ncbi:DUF4231 domain-containing protein [Kitasatospora sp. NPDC001574]|uniref:DUF4231 domain-containing protein n=1 Tax=Streptomyces sp. BE303 TaxID=3002528 RepID=UPI002E77F550|nr:DUF4231 domain-containing protein [Streptomyces sp. BE303]MED7947862.1 DUF4231 domain-containing protein [Streptomyces sp. BE303]
MTAGASISRGMQSTPEYRPVLTSEQEQSLQETYRRKVKEFDQLEVDLRGARAFQRIFLLSMLGAISLAFLLGYTVIIGLWNTQPLFTRYAGLAIVVALWVAMGRLLWANRKKISTKSGELRNALQDRQTAAAQLPLDSPSALRIYREASLEIVDQYRKGANKNRRVHNFFQVIIITGSIVTSTLTAMNDGGSTALRLGTALLSGFVGISAGVTGYFKFRERGYNLQSTADEIEKHYNASQFMLDEYAGSDPNTPLSEDDRLRTFARFVERLKEEQRKRELQLEQSSSASEEHAG